MMNKTTARNVIRCKLNGRALAMRLDGGYCICASTDQCIMAKAIKNWNEDTMDERKKKAIEAIWKQLDWRTRGGEGKSRYVVIPWEEAADATDYPQERRDNPPKGKITP